MIDRKPRYLTSDEIRARYPRLIRAACNAAILCTTEAIACIRDYAAGMPTSGEAVNHFGGTRAVLSRAASAWNRRIMADRRAYYASREYADHQAACRAAELGNQLAMLDYGINERTAIGRAAAIAHAHHAAHTSRPTPTRPEMQLLSAYDAAAAVYLAAGHKKRERKTRLPIFESPNLS